MKNLILSAALLMTLTPTLALARTHEAQSHMRPRLFHDRAPRPHDHGGRAHQPA
jgi:hypothetical protein